MCIWDDAATFTEGVVLKDFWSRSVRIKMDPLFVSLGRKKTELAFQVIFVKKTDTFTFAHRLARRGADVCVVFVSRRTIISWLKSVETALFPNKPFFSVIWDDAATSTSGVVSKDIGSRFARIKMDPLFVSLGRKKTMELQKWREKSWIVAFLECVHRELHRRTRASTRMLGSSGALIFGGTH